MATILINHVEPVAKANLNKAGKIKYYSYVLIKAALQPFPDTT